MAATQPKIAAVIVCHNAAEDLSRCLAALEAGSLPPALTCIVDSGSDDTGYLAALSERPQTICIREANIGYGPGNNLGLAEVPPDIPVVLFLNPDCFVLPYTLERAATLFEADPDLAALGPRLLGFDREHNAPTGLLDSTGIVRAWYGRWRDRGQGEPDDGRYNAPETVPALCGACLFCRRSALEAVSPAPDQAFDPAFFLYKEDIELCLRLRLRKRGFRLLYHPAVRAHHCRGWQGRAAMSRELKLIAAANEIRLYLRHPSPYMLWALLKYALVRCLGV